MKKIISSLAATLLLVLASGTASATAIEGEINFTGGATISTTGSEISTIIFSNTRVEEMDSLVTGNFDGLENLVATFSSFDASSLPSTFWSVGGFTFTITDVLFNEVATAGRLTSYTIYGNGYITGNSFDQTSAEWIITANGTRSTVSFSSTAIPAPAGAALLGLSLLGFGFARRNKKS